MAHHLLLNLAAHALMHALQPAPQPRRAKQPTNMYAVARKLARAQGVAVPRKRRAAKTAPLFTDLPTHGALFAPRDPRGYEC